MFLVALISDSDNLVFAGVTQGALVTTAIFLASDRRARKGNRPAKSISYS